MRSSLAWIPAAAAVALFFGCGDSKPTDKVPAVAPAAIKQPHEVLAHLQYLAVRKDWKHIPVLDPVDPAMTDGAAWWFNSHAGDMGLALTQAEIDQFGLKEVQGGGFISTVSRQELQKKIDELNAGKANAPAPKGKKGAASEEPQLPAEMKGLDVRKLDFPQNVEKAFFDQEIQPVIQKNRRALFQGGLCRLLKGMPESFWAQLNVLETRKDPNPRIQVVSLALEGKLVLQTSLYEREDKTFGLTYVQFKLAPSTLFKAYAKQQASEKK